MKSMTGYASSDKVFPALGQRISLELKTLNSRYLEFKLKAPSEYTMLEPQILKEVK
ncbi:MAG: YicC family protein, partial [Deltaproteobacteria bacterium]|nr:YicC family protein [Deltaproteobacteria bacterium]